MFWPFFGFGGLWMLLIVAGVVVLIVWAARQGSGQQGTPSRPRALDILDERFARGEIDEEEYRKRRTLLEG